MPYFVCLQLTFCVLCRIILIYNAKGAVFMDNPIIEERLKVFVSSAMGAEKNAGSEDSFKWLEFRKKVKNTLNHCSYIHAFTIEDRTSTMKSNDFMVANVDSSDIVVLLIKNEFRDGTECLWFILDSQYAEQAEKKIYEMSIDPAPAIKSRLLRIFKGNNSAHSELVNKITLNLVNDANYMIRKQAKDILESNLKTI